MVVIASFGVELERWVVGRRFSNNVDDAADGIRAVFGRCRTADDFDAFNIFRADSHSFITAAHIFRFTAHDGLTVNEHQRMTRVRAADSYADAPHGIDGPRDAGFTKDNIF